VKAFARAVESGDIVAALALVADDVVFRSPAVHRPYEGKPATEVVLRAVARVFEDFHYTGSVSTGDDHVLVFQARIGDRQLEGADFLHVDADGLVDDFRVMVRPLSGLTALVEAMAVVIPEVIAELGPPPDAGGS
jgi:hypothetical protein